MATDSLFRENSDVPGTELEILSPTVSLGEDVDHVSRESELCGCPTPVMDDMDALAIRVGCRVEGDRRWESAPPWFLVLGEPSHEIGR